MIFVANCKAYVYRIKQMYLNYPEDQNLQEKDMILKEIEHQKELKKKYVTIFPI